MTTLANTQSTGCKCRPPLPPMPSSDITVHGNSGNHHAGGGTSDKSVPCNTCLHPRSFFRYRQQGLVRHGRASCWRPPPAGMGLLPERHRKQLDNKRPHVQLAEHHGRLSRPLRFRTRHHPMDASTLHPSAAGACTRLATFDWHRGAYQLWPCHKNAAPQCAWKRHATLTHTHAHKHTRAHTHTHTH